MADEAKTDADAGASWWRRGTLLVSLAIAAVLFALAWLGQDDLGVRLGGVDALERIAGDSERDLPAYILTLHPHVAPSRRTLT